MLALNSHLARANSLYPGKIAKPATMGAIISLLSRYYVSHPETAPDLEPKPAQTLDPHAALASELRGKRMRVDMTRSFRDWPSGTRRHPDYERLRHECDRVLERYKFPLSPPSNVEIRGLLTFHNEIQGRP